MGKHTKGDWTVNGDQVEVAAEHNDGYRICDVFGPDYKANATLIAAAPDLLDAAMRAEAMIDLIQCVAYQIGLEGTKEWDEIVYKSDIQSTLSVLRSGISKAEGR